MSAWTEFKKGFMRGLFGAPKPPEEITTFRVLKANLQGHNVIIDYIGDKDRQADKRIMLTDRSEEDLRLDGYLTAIHFLTGWKWILTPQSHTFVRFSKFASPPETSNKETSSTLYDFSQSKTKEEFIKHLIKIKFDALDTKRIITIGAIVIGAVLGFILFGGL